MLTGTIIAAVVAALVAAPLVGLLLLRRLLAGETQGGGEFDTSAGPSAPLPLHAMIWRHVQRMLGQSPRLLTYRRDRRGRFRNVRR